MHICKQIYIYIYIYDIHIHAYIHIHKQGSFLLKMEFNM